MTEMMDDSTVVVIDDDELIWMLMRDVLRQLGLLEDLRTFSEAEMALEFLRTLELPPASLVVDLNLPGMDGIAFLEIYDRELRPRFARTAVFVVSASTELADRQRALAFDFVASYHAKPLRLAQLREILRPVSESNAQRQLQARSVSAF